MKTSFLAIYLLYASLEAASAFSPPLAFHRQQRIATNAGALNAATVHPQPDSELPFFLVDDAAADQSSSDATEAPAKKPLATPKPKRAAPKHNEGILSPLVLLTKNVVGDAQLNKLRAKAISMHSDVIGSFVDTSSSDFGNSVLRAFFEWSDRNHNGLIEEDELADALHALGFDWLKEKQVHGIFNRADADQNGSIDVDEWINEAPKTLRTNLIKLAKKNGGELGLLV